jgi:hypothetical protein
MIEIAKALINGEIETGREFNQELSLFSGRDMMGFSLWLCYKFDLTLVLGYSSA